jgi:hypothetical protein
MWIDIKEIINETWKEYLISTPSSLA